jgi:putative acetyltransferase
MIRYKRTDSADPDFRSLVVKLDRDLAIRDGEMHGFYNQFNTIVNIRNVVVAYSDETPAGCGAFKDYSPGSAEVKRMFVMNEYRRKGIAAGILDELEIWAGELGYVRCILETGINQPEAIALYSKNGYSRIPNYDQYVGVETSVCFEKQLINLP